MKIITLKRTNFLLFLLSIFFLVLIFLIDLGFYYMRNYPSNIYGLREFMIVFALSFFGWLIYRQRYIQEKDIVYKL